MISWQFCLGGNERWARNRSRTRIDSPYSPFVKPGWHVDEKVMIFTSAVQAVCWISFFSDSLLTRSPQQISDRGWAMVKLPYMRFIDYIAYWRVSQYSTTDSGSHVWREICSWYGKLDSPTRTITPKNINREVPLPNDHSSLNSSSLWMVINIKKLCYFRGCHIEKTTRNWTSYEMDTGRTQNRLQS